MLLYKLTAEIEIRPQGSPPSNPLELHTLSHHAEVFKAGSHAVLWFSVSFSRDELNMNSSAAVPPVTRPPAFHQEENLLKQHPENTA